MVSKKKKRFWEKLLDFIADILTEVLIDLIT